MAEQEELPTIREALADAFDEAEAENVTNDEEAEDGDESGQSGIKDGGVHDGKGREVEDGDERSDEPASSETELGVEEEGGDEEHVLTGSDDDLEEEDEEDQEEEVEGREESEEVDLLDSDVEPPDFWPDEVKSEFSGLPPKAKEFMMNSFKGMQADYTQKMQSISEVHKAIDPVREDLARTGVSEGEMIRRFVAVHKRLEEDPAAAVKWISKLYGVNASIPTSDDSDKPAADPRVERLEQHISAQEHQAAIERAKAADAEIKQLRKDGRMPLYEEAESGMTHIVQQLQAVGQPVPTIIELYEKVIWNTPALREKHLAHSDIEKKRAKLVEKKKNVAKSKRAAGKQTPAGAPPVKKKRAPATLRDELSRRYDEAMRGPS